MESVLNNNVIEISSDYKIEQINFNKLSEEDWKDFLDIDEYIEHEINPVLPYVRKLGKKRILIDQPYNYNERWVVKTRKDSKIVGFAFLNLLTPEASDYKENGHTVRTWLGIHPTHRRKKLGLGLIKLLCKRGLDLQKTDISFNTSSESGQKFMDTLTNKIALNSAENMLEIEKVDWNIIQTFHLEASKKSVDVSIETYNSIPDRIIDEYAKVFTAILNDVPFGDLGLRFTITPHQIKVWEDYNKKIGNDLLIKISREPNGRISGLTEIKYNPLNPTIVDQGLTGVLKNFRGKNIGMLLKSDMLLTIKEKYPQAKVILTGNADDNAPMLRINHLMGFKRAASWKAYKFQLNELFEKIS